MNKYKVLIVDDSPLMRELLTAIINAAPDLEVVGTAANPLIAREKIKELNPDVVTLDIEMPEMDGISFLEKIMRLRPMPVVMISSLTQEGAEETLRALEIGAVDFVGKPSQSSLAVNEKSGEIAKKVSAAAASKVKPYTGSAIASVKAKISSAPIKNTSHYDIIAIGASTGGISAIREVLVDLPENTPPIVITQHMPKEYTSSFAARLDRFLPHSVKEAEHNEILKASSIYIAPGDQHMELKKSGASYKCLLNDGERVSGHRPSVDVMFASVADQSKKDAIGVILTGMGRDGASGLLEMRKNGALTIGQDEASCVVYGMPKVAMNAGAVSKEISLKKIGGFITKVLTG